MKCPVIPEKLPRISAFGESEEQAMQIDNYAQKQIDDYFFKLHYKSLPLIIKMRECFPLYFYMCDNVTRGKGRYQFWSNKVVPYYKQGYLPFAKHQSNIATDLGISQSSVSIYLNRLLENNLIAKIGREEYSLNRSMDIWAVGKWVEDDKGIKHEVYYLQAMSFK